MVNTAIFSMGFTTKIKQNYPKSQKMHILQPKHSKLKQEEVEKLLEELNVSLSQLPKIKAEDKALPEDVKVGDIIKIERKEKEGIVVYYRVVV